jgi:hypothetical protein
LHKKLQNLKHWVKKIMRFFLLILFLGYYGSITLFTHTHIINGITIVHSHPFNSGTKENPIKHQHTANEFILIQFLAHFLATILFFTFSIEAYKVVLRKYTLQKIKESFSKLTSLISYGLRAPPIIIQN